MALDPVLKRLLDQNDRLIALIGEAVAGNSAVEVIRALNPPLSPAYDLEPARRTSQDPYENDEGHQRGPSDPWGDEEVTLDRIVNGKVHGGWISTDEPEPTELSEVVDGHAEP